MQGKVTFQSLGDKREIQPDVLKCQLYSKGWPVKLLNYHPTTAVHLHMEGGLDSLHHLVFHLIARNIMNWPFFLDFVPIDNNDEEEMEV